MGQSWIVAVLALAGIVALLLLLGRGAQRLGLAKAAPRGGRGRLEVREVLAIDARRRAVLLRCDEREVLIVTGGPGGDQVVGWLP